MYPISIHAAREGGDVVGLINGRLSSISIHAAREGGDVTDFTPGTGVYISIHAAREGGDNDCRRQVGKKQDFNPRRP